MSWTKTVVTIREVAEAAGVSVSTVSRVLNDKDDVAPETYQKVKEVIDKLGCTSSLAARGLRSRRKNVICLIVSDLAHAFDVQLTSAVNRALAELAYDLIVCTRAEHTRESSADRERRFVGLLGGGIAGSVSSVVAPTCRAPPAAFRATRTAWPMPASPWTRS